MVTEREEEAATMEMKEMTEEMVTEREEEAATVEMKEVTLGL